MTHNLFDEHSRDHGQSQSRALQAEQKVFGGRFVLQRHLGQGGMGQVWLAHDTALEQPRALKFVLPALLTDASARKRLRNEARLGTELAHPRIVRVFDFVEEAGGEPLAAVVMECVEGRTLSDLLAEKESGFFEPEEIESWVRDVVEGLRYAHEEKQRFHLDLKPGNIIVETATGRAKLLDFGISRSAKDTITRLTGQVSSGTLPYMSPQQLDGEAPAAADDVYGLGATVYELLTGTPPFFRGKLDDQIRTKVPESIMERRRQNAKEGLNAGIGEEVSAAVCSYVSLLLEKLPCHRKELAAMKDWTGSNCAPHQAGTLNHSTTISLPDQNTPNSSPSSISKRSPSFFKRISPLPAALITGANAVAVISLNSNPKAGADVVAVSLITCAWISAGLTLGYMTVSRCKQWGGRWRYATRAIYATAATGFLVTLVFALQNLETPSAALAGPICFSSIGAGVASLAVWIVRYFSRTKD
ncbi:serine/threonine-protein kinase [Prosthecobacter sp.]|uniref:serine/threonine-protein kinase n=1 Tax=Prosthecobacter sp. TaxID=1965333 RepID=UPI00378321C2